MGVQSHQPTKRVHTNFTLLIRKSNNGLCLIARADVNEDGHHLCIRAAKHKHQRRYCGVLSRESWVTFQELLTYHICVCLNMWQSLKSPFLLMLPFETTRVLATKRAAACPRCRNVSAVRHYFDRRGIEARDTRHHPLNWVEDWCGRRLCPA